MLKVLCNHTEDHLYEMKRILESIAEVDYVHMGIERLRQIIGEYDAFFCSVSIFLDQEFYNAAKNLKVIITPSTGTDHVNVKEAEKRNIQVISIKDDLDLLENIPSTAEIAFGLLMSTIRMIPSAFESVKSGKWESAKYRGHMLSGKTIGIIGYGRLGKIMASYASAFRMNVIVTDPYKEVPEDHVRQVDFHTLLKESDIISLHIHLNDETQKMIGRDEISLMKNGVIIINTSRGAIIDETALLAGLECGKIGGAGLDVLADELFKKVEKLPLVVYAKQNNNLIITPHIGGVTYEAQEMAYARAALKMKDWVLSMQVNESDTIC